MAAVHSSETGGAASECLMTRMFNEDISLVNITSPEGPQLTRKALTQFPLPWFLAYVHASEGFSCK